MWYAKIYKKSEGKYILQYLRGETSKTKHTFGHPYQNSPWNALPPTSYIWQIWICLKLCRLFMKYNIRDNISAMKNNNGYSIIDWVFLI